ncbi:aspartic peptidase domain-containing protein [Mycena albidolilacea]|uniref:Aspartic peptidase domain-containing protein n=1 Tax=Mycena albidolilacea TaxID=1033008 RepID=A0AAD6ZUT2_9AGAR|nr:aspartic peptidase domain-containing protein [Mycena albidolilacea]
MGFPCPARITRAFRIIVVVLLALVLASDGGVYPLRDYFPEAGDESSLKPQNSLMHRRDRDVLAQRLSSEGPQDVEIVTLDGSYYMNIGFGSPPQMLLASLNTGLGDIVVFSNLCADCAFIYDPTKSSTSVNTSAFLTILSSNGSISDDGKLTANPEKVDGYVFNDTILLGAHTISSATFLVLSPGAFIPHPAALGLGPAGSAHTSATRTPFWQSVVAAQGAALEFGLWLGPTTEDDDPNNLIPGGVLTLGGVNASLFTGSIEFSSMEPQAAVWELNISGADISVRGKSIGTSLATRRVVFDPTFKYIVGPAADIAALWAAVPGAANLTDTEPALHSFPCSTVLNFTVSFGGRTWLINDTVKRRNINARHLGLILRFPMTSILYNGKQLALLLLLAS